MGPERPDPDRASEITGHRVTRADETVRHASCVAVDGKGVLICGASGTGKSGLALELMGYGAHLVADDRTVLRRTGDKIHASAPEAIRGKIEARGIGILHADPVEEALIVLIVGLDEPETERLPPQRSEQLLGLSVPFVQNYGIPHLAAAIHQYLKGGRSDDG